MKHTKEYLWGKMFHQIYRIYRLSWRPLWIQLIQIWRVSHTPLMSKANFFRILVDFRRILQSLHMISPKRILPTSLRQPLVLFIQPNSSNEDLGLAQETILRIQNPHRDLDLALSESTPKFTSLEARHTMVTRSSLTIVAFRIISRLYLFGHFSTAVRCKFM